MSNFVCRLCSLRKLFSYIGFALFGVVAFMTTVTLKHLVDTPQPLESALPGAARLYRWRSQHIFYKEMGEPELPPIVLLHNPGLGASAYEMRHIMAKLAERYHVYAPDLPGFGLSDRPNIDYTVETYTTFCRDFLTDVVQRPAALLASGISCAYAVDIAQRYPQLCERLILISPVAFIGTNQVPRVLLPLLRISTFGLVVYAVCSTRTALRRLLMSHDPQCGAIQAEEALTYLYAATHRFGAEHAPLALWRGKLTPDATNRFEQPERVEDIQNREQPTLLLWGAQALQNTRFNVSEHPISANTQLAIMRDAGIYVHEQYPDVVITDILDWSDATGKVIETPEPETLSVTQAAQEPVVEQECQIPQLPQLAASHVIEAYCVKCKRKTAMLAIQAVTMKNGRPALRGVCAVCGTGLFRIGAAGKE